MQVCSNSQLSLYLACSGTFLSFALIIYRIAQNFGGVKLWRIDCFRALARQNIGEFTIAHISYFGESEFWLGKILANGVPFAKSAKVFPQQNLRYMVYYERKFQLNSLLTNEVSLLLRNWMCVYEAVLQI